MSKKRGQLSTEEMDFIKKHMEDMTIEEIAQKLNRNNPPIQKFIDELNSKGEETDQIRRQLYCKPFWKEIQKQFDSDSGEIEYFEQVWCSLINQFRSDVLPAEELQIKQFITLDILANRSMKERKRHIQETERLQKLVEEEYRKPENERDMARLSLLEPQLSFARNSLSNYTTEYTKLLDQAKAISKDLKATREQRIKRIEEGKSSWASLVAMLEDEEIREREGRQMEILKLSTDKFKDKLYSLHQYQDGKVDRPILNAESVMKDEEK